MKSAYRSIKHESYFAAYDALLEEYVGNEITFVEVGVLDGGSLFMWRDFFGDKARIIGIEINENAKIWEDHGFEIFIGSQSDPNFWKSFFQEVGDVDVLLDDGGHTYQQQIVTVESALEHINPGGKIIVEDTYTSYLKEYGAPSKYSFINYATNMVDGMNLRTPKIKSTKTANYKVSSITFFESIVALSIEKPENLQLANGIPNNGQILGHPAESLRYADKSSLSRLLGFVAAQKYLQNIPIMGKLFRKAGRIVTDLLQRANNKVDNYRLRKFFRYK